MRQNVTIIITNRINPTRLLPHSISYSWRYIVQYHYHYYHLLLSFKGCSLTPYHILGSPSLSPCHLLNPPLHGGFRLRGIFILYICIFAKHIVNITHPSLGGNIFVVPPYPWFIYAFFFKKSCVITPVYPPHGRIPWLESLKPSLIATINVLNNIQSLIDIENQSDHWQRSAILTCEEAWGSFPQYSLP